MHCCANDGRIDAAGQLRGNKSRQLAPTRRTLTMWGILAAGAGGNGLTGSLVVDLDRETVVGGMGNSTSWFFSFILLSEHRNTDVGSSSCCSIADENYVQQAV